MPPSAFIRALLAMLRKEKLLGGIPLGGIPLCANPSSENSTKQRTKKKAFSLNVPILRVNLENKIPKFDSKGKVRNIVRFIFVTKSIICKERIIATKKEKVVLYNSIYSMVNHYSS